MSTNDGGPAFPYENKDGVQHGMTLRDYFAAKAMQSFATVDDFSPDEAAECAWAWADAMLAERTKVKA